MKDNLDHGLFETNVAMSGVKHPDED